MRNLGEMTGFGKLFHVSEEKDDEGFSKITETLAAEVRLYREGRHGSEKWANLAAFSDATDLFQLRAIPGIAIDTTMVLYYGEERFQIVSVENVKGKGMYIEILGKKTEASDGKM